MRNKFLDVGEPGYHPLRKLRAIGSGLRYAVLTDFSVLYKLVLAIPLIAATLWLHEWLDAAVVVLATGTALAAELVNTAIEAVCDFMETRRNDKIKIIKDVAAAAAGIAIAAWWAVLVIELVDLWEVLQAA
jgi:diacylglycerol kinase (ATP)